MKGAQLSQDTLDAVCRALSADYDINDVVGRGGMAVVFRATSRRDRGTVAIKVLRPELAALLGTQRFLREIRCAASFEHPGILPLLHSGEAAGLPYYVMPFIDGETLRRRLERKQRLSVVEALDIADDVARALEHAHRTGIVHRDIKPDNLFLTDAGTLVADFGMAYIINGIAGGRITDPAMSVGTPEYMSPEQADGSGIDGRSDVYSLACVMYEMLAGVPPITGRTAQQVLARKARQPPPSLTLMRPDVPAELARVVSIGLARSPAYRYHQASDFALALRRSVRDETRAVG